MKKSVTRTILMCSSLMLLVALNVSANEEDKPTAWAGCGVFTKYVWRGFELSDDSIVLQPSISIEYKGFGVNLWGNLDTDYDDSDLETDDDTKWSETDLTLWYGTDVGPVSLGLGYIYYALDAVDDSQEFYISAGLDVLLAPTLTLYREVAHLPSWYINLSVSNSFDLPHKIILNLAGSVGYYYSDDDDFVEVGSDLNPTTDKYRDFHDGFLSMSLTIPVADHYFFSPTISYSFPLSDNADYLLDATSISKDSDFFYGGFTVGISF